MSKAKFASIAALAFIIPGGWFVLSVMVAKHPKTKEIITKIKSKLD